jgi:hypothetical protein
MGESCRMIALTSPLNAVTQIAKFDEQREGGTFPASLEP